MLISPGTWLSVQDFQLHVTSVAKDNSVHYTSSGLRTIKNQSCMFQGVAQGGGGGAINSSGRRVDCFLIDIFRSWNKENFLHSTFFSDMSLFTLSVRVVV